jgi:hypothetical protein
MALVLASLPFDASDYVYDFERFKNLNNNFNKK